MPSITRLETDKLRKARARLYREKPKTYYRAECADCNWHYEGSEVTREATVKGRAATHVVTCGHRVLILCDIRDQLCETLHPRTLRDRS